MRRIRCPLALSPLAKSCQPSQADIRRRNAAFQTRAVQGKRVVKPPKDQGRSVALWVAIGFAFLLIGGSEYWGWHRPTVVPKFRCVVSQERNSSARNGLHCLQMCTPSTEQIRKSRLLRFFNTAAWRPRARISYPEPDPCEDQAWLKRGWSGYAPSRLRCGAISAQQVVHLSLRSSFPLSNLVAQNTVQRPGCQRVVTKVNMR